MSHMTFDLIDMANETVLNAMNDGYLILDSGFHYVSANPAFFGIFPQAAQIRAGMPIDWIDSWPEQLRKPDTSLTGDGKVRFSLIREGKLRYLCAYINRIMECRDLTVGWAIIIRDISESVVMRNKLENMAYIDELTGIANRRYFMKTAREEFERLQRKGQPCSVIIFDLDHFKSINDTYGHMVGDEVLKAIACRVRKILRPYDLFGRYGGEEFIILADIDESMAMWFAMRIRDVISGSAYIVDDVGINCAASFGVASGSGNKTQLEKVIRNADIALYKAKRNGRNKVEVYLKNGVESEILRSVEAGFTGFRLFYQPIFSTDASRCVGAESLLRWESPNNEMIMPDSVIPVVEKLGLMSKVEKWVLNTACSQCKSWISLFRCPDFYVHVNLSQELLTRGTLFNEVKTAIERSGISAGNLVLEFKDISKLCETDRGIESLNELKQKDVRIALDSFGEVYSSLSVYKKMFVDEIRMNRSFITDIEDNDISKNLLAGMIHMIKNVDQRICAVGVETDAQREFLQAQGIDTLQGYLFGEPVDPNEFEVRYCI